MRRRIGFVLSLAVLLCLAAGEAAPIRIEKKAADYQTTTLDVAGIQRVKKDNLLVGIGEATYQFAVPQTGWYALYVQAAEWSTDLLLDGKFLIHTAFNSGVWTAGDRGAHKTVNLYLTEGEHLLTLSRPWHPGLPYMTKFYLQPAADVSGRVRLTPEKDYLVFRRGEAFSARLAVGKGEQAETVILLVTDAEQHTVIRELRQEIPAGTGNVEATIAFPTNTEGAFDIEVRDAHGTHVDRTIQYCVVDTRKPAFPAQLQTQLVETIDATTREPDYARGATRVVNTPLGAYRESADLGREAGTAQASWFAYTLNLPEAQADYLMRIEYPDDDQRETAIVLVERQSHPMPAQGYSTGGVYPLSNTIQTQDFYFTARERDARVLFYNWNTGARAAARRITISRITGGFPSLRYGSSGRMYGMYQEEPMRFLYNFGARMGTDDAQSWINFRKATERVGQRLNFAGINLWFPTIVVYGNTLWPQNTIPGFQVGILPPGPATRKEPLRKDVMRLMLLTSEKYGLNFIGDLNPSNLYLEKRFAEAEQANGDGAQKPWLTVSRSGESGMRSPYRPYYNPLYPGVQAWTAEVFTELADRYRDMPAFKGLRIRLMLGWACDGWQTFRDLDWGYEDYTVDLFSKETGIAIPVSRDDPQRFQKRYEFLVRNHYEAWVSWRCRKIYAYHSMLAAILTATRPDMQLYLDPDGADVREWRESAIDPALYAANPAIMLTASRGYPDAANRNPEQPLQAATRRDENWSATPFQRLARKTGDGTVTGLEFGTNHEGPYAKPEELGYDPKTAQTSVVYPDATLNPPGIHFLQRFTGAMADGNITFMHDGSHGYVLGQTEYLRPFLAEYRALPAIGMRLLKDSDPAVLWFGGDGKSTYFYLANRAWYPVDVTVTFSGTPRIERLTTGKVQPIAGNRLTLTLQPYQLLAFRNALSSKPTDITLTIPQKERDRVQTQIAFVERLLADRTEGLQVVAFSPEDLRKAESRMAEAKQCLAKWQTWRAHTLLLHSDMIKLYEGLHAYPPGLMFRKAYSLAPGALKAQDLLEKLTERTDAKLQASETVAPGMIGEQALVLGEKPVALQLDVPFTGTYRVRCAFLAGEGFDAPSLLYNGRPVQPSGIQHGTCGGLVVSVPVVLTAGGQTLTLQPRATKRAGVLGVHLEPLYHDCAAGNFSAIGPFPGVMGALNADSMAARMDAPNFPEEAIDLLKQYDLEGKTLAWVRPREGVQSTDSQSAHYVDLHKTFGEVSAGGKGSLSYAFTTVECPEERKAQLSIGVDYWAKIWVNGEVVFGPGNRPSSPPLKGESKIPITLRKGVNQILLKIHAGSNGNGFWMSITDPGDLRYPNAG